MPLSNPNIVPYGDNALLVEYNHTGYSEMIARHVQALAGQMRKSGFWREIVAGYDSLLVSFDPALCSAEHAVTRLDKSIRTPLQRGDEEERRCVEIPVCYGGEFGPDMKAIMTRSGLTEQGVIDLHSGQDYLVCMMGFIPGFCFLSEVPKKLHHERHATPRQHVEAGSIGIAGWQAGIYGLASPGGWQIIGRTPIRTFDKDRQSPFLIEAGDRVRFVPVGPEIFEPSDEASNS